jgi:hypothetical protein
MIVDYLSRIQLQRWTTKAQLGSMLEGEVPYIQGGSRQSVIVRDGDLLAASYAD